MFESSISKVTALEAAGNYGHIVAEPLEPGFGVTLGNALRRTLLSSLSGTAVTWVRIDGVQHEFSPIPNVKEDTIEFLLNVKQLRICSLSQQPGKLFLEVTGEGRVYAADIKPSADFRISNPELYLATVDSPEAKLSVEFNVELGKGYVPARSSNGLPIGALPTDAIFSPVRKVNFSVEPIRRGQEGSPEKLSVEVWTDGTISPEEAINQSANILISQFSSFRDLIPVKTEGEEASALARQYSTPLEELNLSVRSYNSLKRAGMGTLGQLLDKSKEGLPQLPGLGAKSREEVETTLASLGFPIISQKKKRKKET